MISFKKFYSVGLAIVLLSSFVSFPNFVQPAYSQTTTADFKVAFIGDQDYQASSVAVLSLIQSEQADMVIHSGDFDYYDNPEAWDTQINSVLGDDYPYFASIGNHDVIAWDGYQQKLQERLDKIPGAVCTGDLGVKSSCHYNGLFFILSGVGTMGSGHTEYIHDELAADDSVWSICSWHKNMHAMQVGGKGDVVGWDAYEECRMGGAIIATAHEHSYERTKNLISTEFQTVDPEWSDPTNVRVASGSTIVFVSGLGGASIRDQERCESYEYPYGCKGEWASIYTSDQDANFGALFCTFNVDGVPDKASCYFKDILGNVPDTFEITSFMGQFDPNDPPVAQDDSDSTLQNSPVTIDVLANDSDSDGDSLIVFSNTQGSNGAVTTDEVGVTYTPDPNFVGVDTFEYTTSDGKGGLSTATVTVTVNGAPVTITYPLENSVVNGKVGITVSVNGFASEPIIRFYLDGVFLGDDSSSPYQWGWHTKGQSPDTYVIKAEADGDSSLSDTVTVIIEPKGGGGGDSGGGDEKPCGNSNRPGCR